MVMADPCSELVHDKRRAACLWMFVSVLSSASLLVLVSFLREQRMAGWELLNGVTGDLCVWLYAAGWTLCGSLLLTGLKSTFSSWRLVSGSCAEAMRRPPRGRRASCRCSVTKRFVSVKEGWF